MVILSFRDPIINRKVLVDCSGIGINNILSALNFDKGKIESEISRRSKLGVKDQTVARCLRVRIGPPVPVVDQLIPPQQVSTTEDIQFLHGPTDTFQAVGSLPDPILESSIVPTGALFLKMNQTEFPTANPAFTAVDGRSRFDLVVDPRVLGTSKKFVFRILVHDLTGTNRTEKRIDFVFSPQRQQIDLGYIGLIPQGSNHVRVELQAFTDDGKPASNVFNDSGSALIRKGTIPPPPPPTKTCQCIDPNTGVITVTSGHPANEVCPVCRLPPPPPPEKKSFFESITFDAVIVGGLAVAALMPRGDKKK